MMLNVVLAVATAWFVVNEDNDHFFKADSSLMTEKGLTDYIDYIARGKVTHLFFCVNGQRTSYDSKTWEPIWTGLNDHARPDTATAADGTHDRWAVNCLKLKEAGIDPYEVWIRRCREKGISPWVSMRMNDVHGCNDNSNFRTTTWYKQHPEYRLDPTGKDVKNWFMQQLDYAHPKVREYTMAQLKEVAERYSADGMEIDWMRFGYVFKPGEEIKNAHLLDEFMREAAKAIKATGKQVAVRVPLDHEVCEEFGFNVVKWAKEGLVDVIIPAPFIRCCSSLPVRKWKEALAGMKVRLVPDLGCEVGGNDRTYIPNVYRGVAFAFYQQGADGAYLYNLPYKSKLMYATDSKGKEYANGYDVAAELYKTGLLPEDVTKYHLDFPVAFPDYPSKSMRNDAKWDAFFAKERTRYEAMQKEIDEKSANGGGKVEVEGTVYCDGPINLKSGVELHFKDGARLIFTDNPKRYPTVLSNWEGVECYNLSPLIYAFGQTNVAITGKGTIEPRMMRWYEWMANHNTKGHADATAKLYDWCTFGAPVSERVVTKLKEANARPQLMQFNRCGNIKLSDFRIRNSPFWVVHLFLSSDIHVKGIDIQALGNNSDGIDVDMSKNVLIEDCTFCEGDDAVVFKAGRNQDGWRLNSPTENVEVRNCTIYRGNAIFGVGSEMSGGVRNVYVHDCKFVGFGGSLLELKTNERRGGFIKNIRVENIEAPGVLLGSILDVRTDCFFQWRRFKTHQIAVTEISDITLKNIHANMAHRKLTVNDDQRNPIRNLKVENVTCDHCELPDLIRK